MAFFLQQPPTGVYPNAVIERTDECWVYRWDAGWCPVTEPGWYRYWGGRGTEFIPDVVIDALDDPLLVKSTFKAIIEGRPAIGAFGVWNRDGLLHLPSSDGHTLHTITVGLIWHPDPEAFAHCRAQEEGRQLVELQQKTFREPSRDLSWTRFDTLDDLWLVAVHIL